MFPKFPILLQKPIELLGVICFTLYTRSKYFFPGYETFLQVSNWIPISISRGILVQVFNVSNTWNFNKQFGILVQVSNAFKDTRSKYFFPGYETFLQVSNWMPISISRGILVQVSNVSKVSNTPTKTLELLEVICFYPVYPVKVFFLGYESQFRFPGVS